MFPAAETILFLSCCSGLRFFNDTDIPKSSYDLSRSFFFLSKEARFLRTSTLSSFQHSCILFIIKDFTDILKALNGIWETEKGMAFGQGSNCVLKCRRYSRTRIVYGLKVSTIVRMIIGTPLEH